MSSPEALFLLINPEAPPCYSLPPVLTNLSTCLCCRLADRKLVPHVLPSPPNPHHRSVHFLRHVAGASDNGEPQSLRPQRRPHRVQLWRGGSLALHVLRGEWLHIAAMQWCLKCRDSCRTACHKLVAEQILAFLPLSRRKVVTFCLLEYFEALNYLRNTLHAKYSSSTLTIV